MKQIDNRVNSYSQNHDVKIFANDPLTRYLIVNKLI